MDENAVGSCAELIFAPIDASFADDAPLLPSGFRIIPLDSGKVSLVWTDFVWVLEPILHILNSQESIAGSLESKSHP